MRNLLEKVLVAMLVFDALATADGKPELKLLYHQHRWFDLREAIKGNEQNVPDLYLGAVASAFNNREGAEKYLRRAIQPAPDSEDAIEAHEMLGYLYARSGRYRDVFEQFDAMLRIEPGRVLVFHGGVFGCSSRMNGKPASPVLRGLGASNGARLLEHVKSSVNQAFEITDRLEAARDG